MTVAEFKAYFAPAFEAVSAGVVQRHLDAADEEFNVERWGGRYTEGLANFVAHRITMDPSQGGALKNAGATGIIEKQVGSVRVTRSAAFVEAQTKNSYFGTLYGQRYSELRDEVGMGTVAV
jgi:hypothetical protein